MLFLFLFCEDNTFVGKEKGKGGERRASKLQISTIGVDLQGIGKRGSLPAEGRYGASPAVEQGLLSPTCFAKIVKDPDFFELISEWIEENL